MEDEGLLEEVVRCVEGVHFPASKHDVIRECQRNHGTLRALEALADAGPLHFRNMETVAAALLHRFDELGAYLRGFGD